MPHSCPLTSAGWPAKSQAIGVLSSRNGPVPGVLLDSAGFQEDSPYPRAEESRRADMSIGGTIFANLVSGALVALIAAGFGLWITNTYTRKHEEARAKLERELASKAEEAHGRRDRDLAAAAELYRVYGDFFAAWKVWDAHLREVNESPTAQMPRLGLPDDQRRSELLTHAAQAEGGFEALFIRLTLERPLNDDQLSALWCLREASQTLRRAMKAGEPFLWWKSDRPGEPIGHDGYRAYRAFKKLTSLTADLLMGAYGTPARQIGSRLQALRRVTSSPTDFTKDSRFRQEIEKEQAERVGTRRAQTHWEWIVVAEQLPPTQPAARVTS